MALARIEKLIEQYLQGETSIAEENELRDYFSSSDVAQHLEQYKIIFGYFSHAKEQKFTQKLPLKTKKRNRIVWLSIAATTVVMLGVGTFMYLDSEKSNQFVGCTSEDDPEVVLQETQKALDLVSKNINVGINSVNYINEYDNTRKTIFK